MPYKQRQLPILPANEQILIGIWQKTFVMFQKMDELQQENFIKIFYDLWYRTSCWYIEKK